MHISIAKFVDEFIVLLTVRRQDGNKTVRGKQERTKGCNSTFNRRVKYSVRRLQFYQPLIIAIITSVLRRLHYMVITVLVNGIINDGFYGTCWHFLES